MRNVAEEPPRALTFLRTTESLNHVNVTRFVNGWTASRICSNQYFSIGELPITTAMLFVAGSTRRMFVDHAGNINRDRHYGIIPGKTSERNTPLLYRRVQHRGGGKQLLSISLEEACSRARRWRRPDRVGGRQKGREGNRRTGLLVDLRRNARSPAKPRRGLWVPATVEVIRRGCSLHTRSMARNRGQTKSRISTCFGWDAAALTVAQSIRTTLTTIARAMASPFAKLLIPETISIMTFAVAA